MPKILSFAGSNSSTSINYNFLQYIKQYYINDMELLDLRTFEVPMYSIDQENESGIPKTVIELNNQIKNAEILLLATSEHNGSYSSYFKSTIDWLSRLDRDFCKDKVVIIVGTSNGRGGAASSIELSKRLMERLGAHVIGTFSLPSLGHVFENDRLIEEQELRLSQFISQLPL